MLSVAKGPVLITRPEHLQQGLKRMLSAAGYPFCSLPLLRIEPIDIDVREASAVREKILNLDQYDKVIFISRNAAKIGADLIDQYWPQLPLGIDWIAIGSGTAAELLELGIRAVKNRGIDSEALLDDTQLQELSGQRILLVKGAGGRTLLQETLEQRGARVDLAEVYQRKPCLYSAVELRQRVPQPPAAIMITSGEALTALNSLPLPWPLPDIRLILPSPRVAELAERMGLTQFSLAHGAADEAMLAELESIFEDI